MNITREYLLEKVRAFFPKVDEEMTDGAHAKVERKRYFNQEEIYYNVSDVLYDLLSASGVSIKTDSKHDDLLNDLSAETRDAFWDLGVRDSLDLCIQIYDLESESRNLNIDYIKIIRMLTERYKTTDFEAKMERVREYDQYRDVYERLQLHEVVFFEELKDDPEVIDYYWNKYHVERTKLDEIDCEDYYFIGCRMGLHAVFEVVMQTVGV